MRLETRKGTYLAKERKGGRPRRIERKERIKPSELRGKKEDGEARGGSEVLSSKIATSRRASRHCRLARSTWGRKVRESTRMERARLDRKREREKDVRQGAYEGARRTDAARPDASYHDAQGATPRASLEGEREKVEG